MRRWEACEIAERIQRMIADERPVYDKDSCQTRPIQFRDVAVLFQSLTKLPLYEDVFKARKLPFLTLSGRGYFDRQEVWDMLDLLRFLHNPADSLALATVLRSPVFAFSDDLLFGLRLMRPDEDDAADPLSLWQALHVALETPAPGMTEADIPIVKHALASLESLLTLAGRATISELLRRALALTNYLAILTGLPDGDRRRGNVEKLLQLAEDSGKTTLGKFSQYLEDLSTREAREGEALLQPGNAVRLMTVHASKGLEFPLVVLADASWERGFTAGSPLIVDAKFGLSCSVYIPESNKYEAGFAHRRNRKLLALREEAERKRLLYVAATRAQDYLLVSGTVRQNRGDTWSARGWLKLLLPALGIQNVEREPRRQIQFAGYPLEVLTPPTPPPPERLRQSASSAEAGRDLPVDRQAYPPLMPPLLEPLPKDSSRPRHFSATQLARLGAFRYASSAAQRREAGAEFREIALTGASEDDYEMTLAQRGRPARLIGLIAHETLRHDAFSAAATSDKMIRAIAWERGLTNEAALQRALSEIRGLLAAYRNSEVCLWLAQARAAGRPVYTELPFMFRRDDSVIHGVIDVLLQRSDDEWVIVDYKTSSAAADDLAERARRFRPQMGIYGAAVKERLGLKSPPRLYLHYLRGNQLIELAWQDCRRELDRLAETVGEIMAADEQA